MNVLVFVYMSAWFGTQDLWVDSVVWFVLGWPDGGGHGLRQSAALWMCGGVRLWFPFSVLRWVFLKVRAYLSADYIGVGRLFL